MGPQVHQHVGSRLHVPQRRRNLVRHVGLPPHEVEGEGDVQRGSYSSHVSQDLDDYWRRYERQLLYHADLGQQQLEHHADLLHGAREEAGQAQRPVARKDGGPPRRRQLPQLEADHPGLRAAQDTRDVLRATLL